MRLIAPGALLLLAAACFSEDPAATEIECEDPVQNATIEILDYRFEPEAVCIQRGGTVTWINNGAEVHTTTGDAPASLWDSGLLSTGAEFARTFETDGEFGYFCEPHPFMRGVVIVQ